MYFVLHKIDNNIKLIDNDRDLNKVINLMEKHALEIIKEEDGLKKVQHAFVKDIDDHHKDGHYLTKHDYDSVCPRIKVWKKETEIHKGYFSDAAIAKITLVGEFELIQYRPKETMTTNICPECNRRSSQSTNLRRTENKPYDNLLLDLKANPFFLKMKHITDNYIDNDDCIIENDCIEDENEDKENGHLNWICSSNSQSDFYEFEHINYLPRSLSLPDITSI